MPNWTDSNKRAALLARLNSTPPRKRNHSSPVGAYARSVRISPQFVYMLSEARDRDIEQCYRADCKGVRFSALRAGMV
jgi:hypothetical protein